MDLEESRRRREEARVRREAGRKRLAGLAALAGVALAAGVAMGASSGDDEGAGAQAAGSEVAKRAAPEPPQLPRGGRRIFPDFRAVAFYGAPQDRQLGALGIGKPSGMVKRLEAAAKPYARKTRPILPVLELIAVVANADPGADSKFRFQQPKAIIDRYLRAARKAKALLLLDIQPGHATFEEEVERLMPWLREPDVGLALDPEWATPGAKPGTVIGSVDAATVNGISERLAALVRERGLPQKLFVLHQFTNDMLKDRETIRTPKELATVLSIDGFGGAAAKKGKYRDFTAGDGRRFDTAFKLFYEEDLGLMKPRSVLALRPPPDLVIYE